MREITSIKVDYKHVDGWHVFSCAELPGLYVASKDAEEAFRDVAPALQKLLKLDSGIECEVAPELTLQEFLERSSERAVAERPAVLSTQRYAVHALHACA